MLRIKLSNIVLKKNEVFQLLSSFAEQMNIIFSIEDEKGKILFGKDYENAAYQYFLTSDEEIVGKVTGDKNAKLVADFLNLLLHKEAEKKKLGTEVLNLYQELNFIFNFSEKLAELINPEVIAEITLKEARHLILSSGGAIVLFDEEGTTLSVVVSSGKTFVYQDEVSNKDGLIFQLAMSGLSEIISDDELLQKISTQQLQSIIYASLKVNQRIMGTIVLCNDQPVQYTAGDLKLLTTLALQSSSAINSAFLYEKNIREAHEREEAMRRIHEITVKFVPREFIRSLGKEVITDVRLGDQVERVVTVLFTDIRDFTTLSEQMTPADNFSRLALL